jgi:hypothetical protein
MLHHNRMRFSDWCYDHARQGECTMDGRFPEALNQQPLGFFASLMHELMVMLIWLLPAAFVFLLTVWVLMVGKAFGGRVSLETALKASLRVGVAVYLFLPLYQFPFFVLGNGEAAGITGLCLDGLILILGIAAAVRVIRRARTAENLSAPTLTGSAH